MSNVWLCKFRSLSPHLNHAFNVESACNVAMKIIVQLILQTSKYSTYVGVGSTPSNAYVSKYE